MFSGEIIEFGEFSMTSSVMRVSDPCYDKEVWCCGTLDSCVKGPWEAAVLRKDYENWGMRTSVLAVRAKTKNAPAFASMNRAACNRTRKWERAGIVVGVDSGQAGFFDDAFYDVAKSIPDEWLKTSCSEDPWYDYCCHQTMGHNNAGIMPYGAVAKSGFGDGEYSCIVHHAETGQIDFAMLVFIDE